MCEGGGQPHGPGCEHHAKLPVRGITAGLSAYAFVLAASLRQSLVKAAVAQQGLSSARHLDVPATLAAAAAAAVGVCLWPGERGAAFAALADMASSLAAVGCQEGFEGYLGAIAAQVRRQCLITQRGWGEHMCDWRGLRCTQTVPA